MCKCEKRKRILTRRAGEVGGYATNDAYPAADAQWLMATDLDVSKSVEGVQGIATRRLRDAGSLAPTLEWVQSGVAVVPFVLYIYMYI